MQRDSVEAENIHAKWLVWQGKGRRVLELIEAPDSRLVVGGIRVQYVQRNLNSASSYLKKNAGTFGQLQCMASQGFADRG
ncbi:hypothetical protein PPGU16_82320 (plasmid) [Paraburkholderia largidicola]|uniref:Uncharacterized protein n=1 Tax=Paraburkholderia largidicola TaxID=3014751 RepID=A0A7I8C3G8_9BURK|nr:hypothetical protein PPGU16_82320 [Paraburkholderia sp. PGU16]